MAIPVSIATLATLNNQSILTQSNSNFSNIQTALQDAVSRSGQSPNTMQSNLDMNNNQIINLPSPGTLNSPARLVDVVINPTVNVPPVGTSGAVVGLLNGNNTYSGTSTFTNTVTLPSGSITNSELANMNANTIKGNNTGSSTTPVDLTVAQVTALLNTFTSSLQGLTPASGGGTSNFLRADGTWTGPSGLLVGINVYSSSQTITIPTGATKANVRLIGGGGGGGGVASSNTTSFGFAGQGGTGGGLRKLLTGLTAGNTLSLIVGAAGVGGAAGNNNGTAGGSTILASGSQLITTLTAGGGSGGGAVNITAASSSLNGVPGVGGTATNGDINIQGGSGVAAFGYGGGVLQTPINNNTGTAVGTTGAGFGGCGTGAQSEQTSGNVAGGNGTAGVCEIEWYA
jgi:hypothetical protein